MTATLRLVDADVVGKTYTKVTDISGEAFDWSPKKGVYSPSQELCVWTDIKERINHRSLHCEVEWPYKDDPYHELHRAFRPAFWGRDLDVDENKQKNYEGSLRYNIPKDHFLYAIKAIPKEFCKFIEIDTVEFGFLYMIVPELIISEDPQYLVRPSTKFLRHCYSLRRILVQKMGRDISMGDLECWARSLPEITATEVPVSDDNQDDEYLERLRLFLGEE